MAQTPGTDNPGNVSRFQRTVLYLHEASPEPRADFATTALGELAEAYIAEADLARRQARDSGRDGKLLGWSFAVDQYASQLLLVMEDIEQGFPVRLSAGRKESVAIAVADRTVILSHPRSDQQSALEQRVLADFCTRHNCELFTPADTAPEAIPVSAARVRPDWTFTGKGPVCSHQGIQVRFDSVQNLARLRLTCEQLLQEVMTLANEIAWQRRHGVSVEWQQLTISATPRRPEHMVRLNAAGDSILVTIPVIYGSADLLEHIKPWIQDRVSNKQPGSIQLDAARYGWEKTAE